MNLASWIASNVQVLHTIYNLISFVCHAILVILIKLLIAEKFKNQLCYMLILHTHLEAFSGLFELFPA